MIPLTLSDPACRRLRARQLRCHRALRRAGMLALAGYTPPEGFGVDRIWRRAGWLRPEHVVVVHEYKIAA